MSTDATRAREREFYDMTERPCLIEDDVCVCSLGHDAARYLGRCFDLIRDTNEWGSEWEQWSAADLAAK
jgi:hypothetical protein